MSYIQDSYANQTHGEDGLLTKEEMIEQEQFGDVEFTDGTTGTISPDGILCPDEVEQMATNSILGSLSS